LDPVHEIVSMGTDIARMQNLCPGVTRLKIDHKVYIVLASFVVVSDFAVSDRSILHLGHCVIFLD